MQIQRRQYKDTLNTNTLIQFYKVEGGDLEIIRMEKHAGMDALVDYHDINNPIIGSLSFFFWQLYVLPFCSKIKYDFKMCYGICPIIPSSSIYSKVGGRLPAGAVEKMNYGPPGKAVLCQVVMS